MATRISHSFLRGLSALIGCLVSLLCGCRGAVQPLYGVVEYGMPSASYAVSGTVRAKASQALLGGIEVTLRDTVGTQLVSNNFSDSLGRYQVGISFGPPEHALRVTASDVDGAANGAFTARDTVLHFTEAELSTGTVTRTVDLDLDSAQ